MRDENEFDLIPDVITLFELIEYDNEIFCELAECFSSKNKEIDDFLKMKSVNFVKQRFSSTYLVFPSGNLSDILGYFTLAIKILNLKRARLSNTVRKIVEKFGSYDENSQSYQIPAILIAQFGRNFHTSSNSIKGSVLMELALEQVREILKLASGKTVFLECEDEAKLVEFYEAHGFKILDKCPDKDEMIQMFRFV